MMDRPIRVNAKPPADCRREPVRGSGQQSREKTKTQEAKHGGAQRLSALRRAGAIAAMA
jgi:hypothetical protein